MKINKLSMALVAAASLLAVSPLAQAQDTNTPAAPARPRGGMSVESQMEHIDKAVTLTDAEKPKVKSALEEQSAAMQAAREGDQSDMRTKMKAAREEFNKKMKDILTPDQYTKFEAMPRPGRRAGGGGGAGGAGGAAGGGNQ
jgi:periplasmic protein CpxP/Spy